MNEIEKAIEHIKERLRFAVYGGSTAIKTEVAQLALAALEKQLTDRWIPVSERLPDNKVVVLITKSTGSVGLGFCNRNSNNQWRDGEGYLLTCPLAWRPLPEKYEEEICDGKDYL